MNTARMMTIEETNNDGLGAGLSSEPTLVVGLGWISELGISRTGISIPTFVHKVVSIVATVIGVKTGMPTLAPAAIPPPPGLTIVAASFTIVFVLYCDVMLC